MKLTRLIELKFNSDIRSDEEYSKFFDALIGTNPDVFNLPQLEVLTCSVSDLLLQRVWERVSDHPASANLRCFCFRADLQSIYNEKIPKWKEILQKFPLEKIDPALPWSVAVELLPLATNARDIVLDPAIRSAISYNDVEEQKGSSNVNLLTTEKVEFLAQHLPSLTDLNIWCPIADQTSFESLKSLTAMRIDPDYNIGKSFQIRSQSIVFPQSLRFLTVAHFYPIEGATIIPSLTPLVNLTRLRWSASSFGFDEFINFIACLPKQLTRIDLTDCLRKSRTTGPFAERTALINLPKLTEFIVSDNMIAKRSISFAFSHAPRLRYLSYNGYASQICHLLESLSKFPESRDRTPIHLFSANIGSYSYPQLNNRAQIVEFYLPHPGDA
jgi:hypothetical protein